MKTTLFATARRSLPTIPGRLVRLALLAAAGATVGSGCTSYQKHYPGREAIRGEGTTHKYVTLEFGERGNALDKDQLNVAKAELRKLRKPLLVVFVHGWHNDATTGGDKLGQDPAANTFASLLDKLNRSPFVREHGFEPLGIYVAWHGKTWNNFPLEYATTFWSRYGAARDLGRTVACRAAIADLVGDARKRGPQNSRTFLIGHSFGALVLEQAVSDSVANALDGKTASLPADLTLFLNSASDSETTRQLVQRLDSSIVRVPGWSEERAFPVFASLTSESDWATNKTFPLGKYPASWGKHFDAYDVTEHKERVGGRYFFTHTPGNNRYLISHATTSPRAVEATGTSPFEVNLRTTMDARRPAFNTRGPVGEWQRWALEPVGKTVTPYWIVKVSKPIMDGHGDIFNDNALALMAALYKLNSQFITETGAAPMLQATDASRSQKPLQSGAEAVSLIRKAMKSSPVQALPPGPAPTPAPPPAPSPAPRRTLP